MLFSLVAPATLGTFSFFVRFGLQENKVMTEPQTAFVPSVIKEHGALQSESPQKVFLLLMTYLTVSGWPLKPLGKNRISEAMHAYDGDSFPHSFLY